MQSSIFHERKQRTNENVDDYAQDLRKLFNRAYSNAQSGGEAEAMGKSVLSNQFVAGLVDKLKAKMVGRTGTFEELLAQARFEEARLKNTTASREGAQPDHQTRKKFEPKRGSGEAQHTASYSSAEDISRVFLMWWHWAFCQRMPPSWKRSSNGGKGKEYTSKAPRVSMLHLKDCEAQDLTTTGDAVKDAVTQIVARMHRIEAGPTSLGPVLTSEVGVDGSTVKALLDTGIARQQWPRDPRTNHQLIGVRRCRDVCYHRR